MTGDLTFHAVARKGLSPGQTLVQHACERIDVGRGRVDFVDGESLWGHVGEGADRGAGAGQLRRSGRAGDAEIDEVGEVVLGHQDVRRFDVAVHEPDAVGGVEGGGDLFHDRYRALRRQRTVCEQFGDGMAVDQPHGHIQAVVDLAEIMDGDDVGLIQPGGHLGLPTEPRLILLIVGEIRGQQLQRDHPVHGSVVRLPHFAHAAAAQQLDQPVPAERCPVHRLTIRVSRLKRHHLLTLQAMGRVNGRIRGRHIPPAR